MLNPGQWCRVPQIHDHKYARGTVLLRTGSAQFPGAATLTVSAAWGVGVGAVKLYANETAELFAQQVLVNAPETLIVGESDDAAVQALVVGSGTTPDSWQGSAATWLCDRVDTGVPLVADAGALLAAMCVSGSKRHLVFTPHQGEFQRMWDAAELGTIPPTRHEQVVTLAEHAETTIVLKGNPTLVSGPDGTVTELPEGTPWLATAGTGDVLAGALGALLATNHDATTADYPQIAATACLMHDTAARFASGHSRGHGTIFGRPITAMDVVRHLPDAFHTLVHHPGEKRGS